MTARWWVAVNTHGKPASQRREAVCRPELDKRRQADNKTGGGSWKCDARASPILSCHVCRLLILEPHRRASGSGLDSPSLPEVPDLPWLRFTPKAKVAVLVSVSEDDTIFDNPAVTVPDSAGVVLGCG